MTSHDSGGDGDDDAQLKSLRAVWLSMPDEDPPERGLAELMAAARVKAEQMAKPSLWQRLAALLRRPPVLALATVLVLIGGAVFIGQRHTKMEVAPEASEQRARMNVESATGSAAMGPANTVAAPEAPAGAAESAPADEESAQPTSAVEAKPEPKTDVAPKIEAPPRVTHRPPPSSAGFKAPTTKTTTTKPNDSVMEKSAQATDKKETKKPESRGFDDTNGLIESDLGEKNDRFSSPPPAEAPAADVGVSGGGTKGAATTQAQPEVRRAQQYIAQAKTAAARGDCAAARTLMKRVASEDAASYRKALASDAALKKCFE